MKDLMLDLETLSTSPRAAIIQIGACFFDRETGEIGGVFKESTAPDLNKYAVDFSTIQWWMTQSPEAQASSFAPATNTLSVYDALCGFSNFCSGFGPVEKVWAMPAAFDVPIVENAFKTEGVGVPWKYNASRDCRTIFDLAGFTKDDLVKPVLAHDALEDAVAQAKSVTKALARIRRA